MDPNTTNNGGYKSGVTKNLADQPSAPPEVAGMGSVSMSQGPQSPLQHAPSALHGQSGASAPSQSPISPRQSTPAMNVDVNSSTTVDIPQESPTIEVEWVEKVESVVKKSIGNPYNKAQNLSMLRAEYLKKIYGKTVNAGGK